MISHAGRVEVLAVEVLAVELARDEPRVRWRTGPGTVSKARWDEAAPLVSWLTARGGNVLPRLGSPGLGVCAPLAPGMVSQYWLSALWAGLVQPGTVAALADSGVIMPNARATKATRTNLGMSDLIPAGC